MMEKGNNFMICVECITFNQSQYIEDTLNGFCIQQTDFPFVCVIIDDASTDGEQKIILRYMEHCFDLEESYTIRQEDTDDYQMIFARHKENINCYFAVYFLKYNHYRIHKPKRHYFSTWSSNVKYTAMCEGDDYWIDPLKLQKQYDMMEAHVECSLCFHAARKIYPSGVEKLQKPSKIKEFYGPKDAIWGGGGFMATNSMFIRNNLDCKEKMPDFWKNCPIGDLPTMLYYASKGQFAYIDDVMSVYRVSAIGSWSSRQNTLEKRTNHHKAIARMYDQYDIYTGFMYHRTIQKKKLENELIHIKDIVCSNMKYLIGKIK